MIQKEKVTFQRPSENMDRYTWHRHIFEIMFKTAFRTIQTNEKKKRKYLTVSFTLSETSSCFYMSAVQRSFENAVGKGEIARNEQFLLFPQCFLPRCRFYHHLREIKIVVCERFPFSRVQNVSFTKRLIPRVPVSVCKVLDL